MIERWSGFWQRQLCAGILVCAGFGGFLAPAWAQEKLVTVEEKPATAQEKICAPTTLLKVTMTTDAPAAVPFLKVPKTLYRVGNKKGRLEEALNPADGVHLLIVVNEPDLWIVDLAQRHGKHLVDPTPPFNFRARLFDSAELHSAFIQQLEIGCEVAWMKNAGITPQQVQDPQAGTVNKWEYSEGAERLTLFEKQGKPLRIELFGAKGWLSTITYLAYESNVKTKANLFTKPANVRFEETTP